MNSSTKSITKAIVYSCCWQSVSVRHVCRQRLYFAKGWRVWRERRGLSSAGMWGYGSHTSERKILLPTVLVFIQLRII